MLLLLEEAMQQALDLVKRCDLAELVIVSPVALSIAAEPRTFMAALTTSGKTQWFTHNSHCLCGCWTRLVLLPLRAGPIPYMRTSAHIAPKHELRRSEAPQVGA